MRRPRSRPAAGPAWAACQGSRQCGRLGRRRVAVVQDQRVSVRISEVRLVADAAVDDLAQELDALRLELGARLRHVVDTKRDRARARLERATDLRHVEHQDRHVPGLELAAPAVAVGDGALEAEHARVERARPFEVGDRQEDKVGLPDLHHTTAASPSNPFASAKKSGIGCTPWPSSSSFGPTDVTASTNTRASPGYRSTMSASSLISPAGAMRASTFSRTSRRSATASNAVTSIATSFVSPACLWSMRPFTMSTRSATKRSRAC